MIKASPVKRLRTSHAAGEGQSKSPGKTLHRPTLAVFEPGKSNMPMSVSCRFVRLLRTEAVSWTVSQAKYGAPSLVVDRGTTADAGATVCGFAACNLTVSHENQRWEEYLLRTNVWPDLICWPKTRLGNVNIRTAPIDGDILMTRGLETSPEYEILGKTVRDGYYYIP